MDSYGDRELLTAYKENGLLVFKTKEKDGTLIPTPNAPKYKRIHGGIGWLDPDLPGDWCQNWLIVIGEREDGIYTAIEEGCGDLSTLAALCLSAKDRYFMDTVWVDDDERTNLRTLRNTELFDGLCGYHQEIGLSSSLPCWLHDASFWPTFRDRSTMAALVPVPLDIKTATLSTYEQLRLLAANGRFRVRDDTDRVSWLMRQKPPLDKVLLHPLLKALCRTLTMMERTKADTSSRQTAAPTPWYGNPR